VGAVGSAPSTASHATSSVAPLVLIAAVVAELKLPASAWLTSVGVPEATKAATATAISSLPAVSDQVGLDVPPAAAKLTF
jgi:hypothetical protein